MVDRVKAKSCMPFLKYNSSCHCKVEVVDRWIDRYFIYPQGKFSGPLSYYLRELTHNLTCLTRSSSVPLCSRSWFYVSICQNLKCIKANYQITLSVIIITGEQPSFLMQDGECELWNLKDNICAAAILFAICWWHAGACIDDLSLQISLSPGLFGLSLGFFQACSFWKFIYTCQVCVGK